MLIFKHQYCPGRVRQKISAGSWHSAPQVKELWHTQVTVTFICHQGPLFRQYTSLPQ